MNAPLKFCTILQCLAESSSYFYAKVGGAKVVKYFEIQADVLNLCHIKRYNSYYRELIIKYSHTNIFYFNILFFRNNTSLQQRFS